MPAFEPFDIVLLVIIALYALNGWQRGFLASVLGLAALVVGVWVAFTYYREAGAWLGEVAKLPEMAAWAVSFVLLAVVASSATSWLLGALLSGLRVAVRQVAPLRLLDALAGAGLGAGIGCVIAAVLATLLVLAPLPFPKEVRAAVDQSQLARPMIDRVSEVAPALEPLLSQVIEDTMPHTTRSEEAPVGSLNFPPDLALQEDREAAQRLFELVNEERAKNGLKPLRWDDRLAEAGRQHAEEMFRLSYFAHDSPVAGSPATRARAAGTRFLLLGENLAYAPTVEVAHTGLMNSPGHRANILSPAFGRLGVGVMRGGIYGRMFAQEFAD